jgi:RNA polymerase II-associated factor 1
MHAPAPHPHDRALLRPLASLGKPKSSDSGVSFLRRTEYISSHTSRSRFDSTTSKTLVSNTGPRVKKLPINIDKESPEYIKQQVDQSFQTAALNLMDPNRVKHPYKRNVRLIESFPILPDLSAFPDAGGYVSVKFQTNPVPPSNVYDIRLDSGLLRPLQPSDEKVRAREDAIAAYERDPERNPFPEPEQDYEFYLMDTVNDAANFKRKYDMMNPDKDDDDLYTHQNEAMYKCFRFKRIRAYETAATAGSQETKYDEEIVISVNDGTDGIHQRAAYYYPLIQRSTIRPQRKKNIDRQRYGFADQGNEDADMIDIVDVTIRDADENETRERNVWIDSPYHEIEEQEELADDDGAEADLDGKQKQEDMDARLKRENGDDDAGSE